MTIPAPDRLRRIYLKHRLYDGIMCEVWESGLGVERQIFVVMRRETKPAVRMTKRSMHVSEAAKAYLDWKAATADYVLLAMRDAGIKPFPRGTRLKMDASFTLAPKTISVFPKNPVRMPYERLAHPAETQDVDNLFKGIADAMKGVLYGDDRRIFDGRMSKREGTEDWTELWVREL